MANRFEQPKVDPSIKKNVARARQNTLAGKSGKGFVVAASVAATLMGWGFFAQQDAQTAVTAQLNDPTPVATSVQQAASTSSTTASSGPQVSSVSQIFNPPTATPTTTTASTSQNAPSTATATATTAATSTATSTPKATATPVVVASTRSSR